MATKQMEAQNPLILRCNRLIEAFAKSDDERDFFLDRMEGFIFYVDIDKPEEELLVLEKELEKHKQRYCMIPKLTFYETKKIMEGFVNEKVYDIDTKEKLLDIIQSKEARENFLEFIYDHHSELEKWQQYYQERSRIRIIEWLRANNSILSSKRTWNPKSHLGEAQKGVIPAQSRQRDSNRKKNIDQQSEVLLLQRSLKSTPKARPPA